MKRILSAALACCLLVPLLTARIEAAARTPEATVVSFPELEALVAASNPDMRALEQSYGLQRRTLEMLEKEHRRWMESDQPLSYYASLTIELQKEISALKLALAYEETDMARALRQQVYLARYQYLAHYICQLDIQVAQLNLDAAQQRWEQLQAQHLAGYTAYARVEEAQLELEAYEKALRGLEQLQQVNVTSLANTLGIVGEIQLSGLPEMDLDAIPARDFQADCAAYQLGAPLVRQRIIELEQAEQAKNAFPGSSTEVTRYAYQLAQENLALAQQLAAQEFPQVYQRLQQAYQDYINTDQVAVAQARCDRAQRQWALGLISRDQRQAAQRVLEQETCALQKQGIELYRTLLYYALNLDYPAE